MRFATKGVPRTLIGRLTLLHLVSMSLLISFAYMAMSISLDRVIDREDDFSLRSEIGTVQRLSRRGPGGLERLVNRWKDHDFEPISARILDKSGRELRVLGDFPKELRPLVSGLKPGAVNLGVGSHGRTFRVLTAPYGEGMIQLTLDRTHESADFAGHRYFSLAILGLAVGLTVLIGRLILAQALNPVARIVSAAGSVNSESLHHRIPAKGLPPELSVIADTFNRMLERLESSFAKISRFSEDIAHELRTPIHLIRGELEVLMSRPREESEYRDRIAFVLEELVRLSELLDTLLFIARSESGSEKIVREPSDLSQDAAQLMSFYVALAEERGLRLSVDASAPVIAEVNRTLFQQALANLVDNALRHVKDGGSVVIRISGSGPAAVIEVEDDGDGIPSEELPHVFQRFFRGTRARGSRGTGLGLAIVRSIVDLHHGRVEALQRQPCGSVFRITLPLRPLRAGSALRSASRTIPPPPMLPGPELLAPRRDDSLLESGGAPSA